MCNTTYIDELLKEIENLIRQKNPNHMTLGNLVLEAERLCVSKKVIIQILQGIKRQK